MTLKAARAGCSSKLPASSIARTSTACFLPFPPFDFALTVNGEAQGAKPASSRRHSNVTPSSDWNETLTFAAFFLVFVFFFGAFVISVSGAAVSTVKAREAGVASAFAVESTARTSKTWAPSGRAEVVCSGPGPEQAPNAPESTRHSNAAGSLDEKANV